MIDINKSKELMEEYGLKIKFSRYFFENDLGYSATAVKKAQDINDMFSDPEVKAIFCATGGANCNMVFEYLDYDLIRKNPKIICGFSDSTSILNVINEKTGLITFHGPTFKALTSWETDYAYCEVIDKFVEGKMDLSREKDKFVTIKEGVAEGKLIGGNLSIITKLVAGKYKVDFVDKILFIEELGFESDPEIISGNLYYLKQNGVFDKIKGIWVGNYQHESNISLERITDEFTKTLISDNPKNIIFLYKNKIFENLGIYCNLNGYEYNELEKNLNVLKYCENNLLDRLIMLEYIISSQILKNIDSNKGVIIKFKY